MKSLLQFFSTEPKKLFLLDAIGAFITATFIGVVMRNNIDTFGLSSNIAFLFASIAYSFVCFSGICYLFVVKNHYKYLYIISSANSLYVLVSLYILFNLFTVLTTFGKVYLLSEISTIVLLVIIEFSVAMILQKKK